MRWRSSISSWTSILTLLLACLSWTQLAAADDIRVVVRASEHLDGKTRNDSSLLSVASRTLRARGLRVVDAKTALSAQLQALAKEVEAGRVPGEISALNADVLLSLDLSCERASAGVMGSKIQAYGCVVDSRLLRLGSGQVLLADNHEMTGHGLSASAAVQSVLRKRLPEALATSLDRWLADERDPDATFQIELVVTRVGSHARARALSPKLARLAGVSRAELRVFDDGVATYTLAGRGRAQAQQLAAALDVDPDLGLTPTFESSGLIHAQFDAAESEGVPVMMMAVAPEPEAQLTTRFASTMPENLPYLQVAQSAPWIAAPAEEGRELERLQREAGARRIPLLLTTKLSQATADWQCAFELRQAKSGQVLLSSSAADSDANAALYGALRGFDERYRRSMLKPKFRSAIGLPRRAVDTAAVEGMVVSAFHVEAEDGRVRGTLALEQRGGIPAGEVKLTLMAAGQSVLERALPVLAAGKAHVIELPGDALELAAARATTLQAVVSYRQGEHYARASAFAALPSLVHTQEAADALPQGYFAAVEQALLDRRAGRYAAARKHLERAHGLHPNARTLRGMGFVAYDMGQYAEAAALLRQALESDVRGLTPRLRDEVRQVLARLAHFTH